MADRKITFSVTRVYEVTLTEAELDAADDAERLDDRRKAELVAFDHEGDWTNEDTARRLIGIEQIEEV